MQAGDNGSRDPHFGDPLEPLFLKYQVDIVFVGHVHNAMVTCESNSSSSWRDLYSSCNSRFSPYIAARPNARQLQLYNYKARLPPSSVYLQAPCMPRHA